MRSEDVCLVEVAADLGLFFSLPANMVENAEECCLGSIGSTSVLHTLYEVQGFVKGYSMLL
jgi:hypothetical protein